MGMHRHLLRGAIALTAFLAFVVPASARSPLAISTEPLGTSTGVSVKPNLWFILDNSGSMDWTYTPDWANDSICQANLSSLGTTYNCDVGDVPYMAAGFNKSYYNPAITYVVPPKADGTSMGNASPTAAKAEPFKYPSATTAVTTTCMTATASDVGGSGNRICDLTTKFPRKTWCKGDGTSCLQNTAAEISASARPYAFPGNRGAAAGDTAARTMAGAVAYGAPYYFVMSGSPSWCEGVGLTNCSSSKWTGTSTARTSSTPYVPAYKYPNFNLVSATAGVVSTATITISVVGTGGKFTSVTNGAAEAPTSKGTLFSGTVSVPSGGDTCVNRNAVASSLAASIGNGYTATVTAGSGTVGAGGTCKPVVTIKAPGSATTTTNTAYDGTLSVSPASGGTLTYTKADFSGAVDYVSSRSAVTFTRVDIVPTTTSYTYYATRACSQVPSGVVAGGCCAGASSCTYAEELQNFANWYSYYRSRMLMMKSATAYAFKDVSDSTPGVGFRAGFTTINSPTSFDVKIADFAPSQKSAWYTKLFSVTPGSGTPLRGALSRAGQVYQGTVFTGADDPVKYSCQQNYTFLATDGYWNTDTPGSSFPTVGDVDGSTANPSAAVPPTPYKDAKSTANTLADIARYYYVNDLRPAMTNDVPKASGDEVASGATMMHQHMKTFTMGLGIDGTLTYSPAYRSGGSADYQAILTGAKDWGVPLADSPTAIDDLWHAAVNGHGVYFSAADPTEVAVGIAQTLAAAQQETGSSAAAATSNLEPVPGDNYAYVASYTTSVWDGNLEAKTIDLSTGVISDASSSNIWAARDQLDTLAAAGSRSLITGNGGVGGQRILSWANLTTTEKTYFNPTQIPSCNPIALCPGATNQNMFDFLMGKADATTGGSYRAREHVLGDIVSSQPVYVKAARFNYLDSGYTSYKSSTEGRAGRVYVGANDGFLHAFDANTGAERWAFLPQTLMSKLYKLADPSYQHTYYVDGTLTVGDAYLGAWKTILIGGMNSGGRGYFALDVTSPDAPVVMWEFTDANMGNTYGNPVITKLLDGTWVALLTSGYNNGSTVGGNGMGYLYVVDLARGTLKFTISSNSGSSGSPSGLAKIANWVSDPMGDNTTQYVYGGDLDGNLWRFDLLARSSAKLITAPKPITTKPELAEVNGQRTVFFATGLFLEPAQRDPATNTGNGIYGVRDTGTVSGLSTSGLMTRTMSSTSSMTESDWNSYKGWSIALDSGYFVNVDPKVQLTTLAVAANHVPTVSGDATTSCTAAKGDYKIYFIDFINGKAVLDASHPSVVTGTSLAVGINIIRLPDGKVKTIATTSDNKHITSDTAVASGSNKARRISWRELTTH